MTAKTLLIGDIGGTNARFALARDDEPGFHDALTLKCADFPSGDDAIQEYLSQVSAGSPDVVCLAVAGPVVDETVRMTNNHWILSVADIRQDFKPDAVRLLNDFAAIAYSIPWLADSDHESIGLPKSDRLPEGDFSAAIVGPGTGLGTAGLIRRGGQLIPIVGEGGHVGFAPKSQVQLEILTLLRDKFDRVSAERLVSGRGLENIYWALNLVYGEKRTQLTAPEIFAHSIDGSDPRAVDSTHMFFEILGQVAGDLALILGAEDGVYIAGGIVKRYPEMMHNSGFRNAFENKGRHQALMERIPTQLITHDEPGLLGAAYCALEMSASS